MTKSKPGLFWIDGPWPGRLAIAARPRGGDWLEDEVAGWKDAGVDLVLSTLEPEEIKDFELQAQRQLAEKSGIEYRSLPIPDRQVPQQAIEQELASLESELRGGRNVIVHCRQGIGRSALVTTALLILGGVETEKALALVEQARQRPVPETEEQRDWVRRFAKRAALREAVDKP